MAETSILGKSGSAASKAEFARIIAEYAAFGRVLPPGGQESRAITITEVIAAYWRFAKGYYLKNGKPTGELEHFHL